MHMEPDRNKRWEKNATGEGANSVEHEELEL